MNLCDLCAIEEFLRGVSLEKKTPGNRVILVGSI